MSLELYTLLTQSSSSFFKLQESEAAEDHDERNDGQDIADKGVRDRIDHVEVDDQTGDRPDLSEPLPVVADHPYEAIQRYP